MIKHYPKFAFWYLLNLFIENPWKFIFLTIVIVSFHYAGSFPSYAVHTTIEKEVVVKNGYVYLYPSISDNQITYGIIYSKDRRPLKNGSLSSIHYNGYNFLFWSLFWLFLIIITIGSFLDDTDLNWEFSDTWDRTFQSLLDCEIEHGEYVYLSMGRLIGKSKEQVRPRDIGWTFGVSGFQDLKRCPKYQTTNQRRNGLLNKLGI